MSVMQARPWGKTISSVSLVLAIILLVGCSKQQNPETQITRGKSDPSETDRLKQQVAQLQSTISEKDEVLAKLRQRPTPVAITDAVPAGIASPGQATVQPASADIEPAVQQATKSVTEQEIVFQLKGCALSGSLMKCNLLLTNKAGDKNLWLGRDERSRMFDDAGRVYPATGFNLGADTGGSVRMTLPGDVPVEGQIQVDGVKPGTKRIRLLELACNISDSTGSRGAVIKFGNIDL
jgi:hypothetical protein